VIAIIRLSDNSITIDNRTPGDWRLELPGNITVSPVVIGWEGEGCRIADVVRFTPPDGQVVIGAPSYTIAGDVVIETYATTNAEPVRRLVPKSVILSRLTDAQLDAALAMLTTRQKERWRAADKPAVYFDDAETVGLINAIGADPAVVMAPE
jgi:hypothetical protein